AGRRFAITAPLSILVGAALSAAWVVPVGTHIQNAQARVAAEVQAVSTIEQVQATERESMAADAQAWIDEQIADATKALDEATASANKTLADTKGKVSDDDVRTKLA